MSVFLLTINSAESEASEKMNRLLASKYGQGNYIQLSDTAWLFEDKDSVTPQQACSVLDLNEPNNVAPYYGYLVSAFTGYWGFQESDVWQWLKLRGL
ncbi:hypothetical protein [Shewanella mangrovisoli]|uniref:hypothetical protein n=1 Tax=Shewanella mangrovisoli TaxID=2864211 RepID=UPI001C66099B|nr:hypothetical protein [Shewanella mangrovisoli]QYK07569.1 hypothetical protein K0H60_12025 [Shewanella mangrovisoli]